MHYFSEMQTPRPNQRPGVDAGWRALLAFQRLRPRAIQAECWAEFISMKLQHLIDMSRLSLLSVLLLASGPINLAAQTNAIAKPKTPTGFYVSVAEISPTISIKFDTNGEY